MYISAPSETQCKYQEAFKIRHRFYNRKNRIKDTTFCMDSSPNFVRLILVSYSTEAALTSREMLHLECMCVHYKSASCLITLWLSYIDAQAVDEHLFPREIDRYEYKIILDCLNTCTKFWDE